MDFFQQTVIVRKKNVSTENAEGKKNFFDRSKKETYQIKKLR